MKNQENKICIVISEETDRFLNDVIKYENFRYRIKREGQLTTKEDIVKAALDHFLKDIGNFYKKHIVESKYHLNQPIQLKNRFKQFMEEKGIKQKDLSELTGIDKANLSNILNNKSQPGSDYFLRLWVALDYPRVEDIYYREE